MELSGTKAPRTRLLITGATGFIGSHAVEVATEQGWHVIATGRSSTLDLFPHIEYRPVDLFDSLQVADLMASTQPTHLLHIAWLVTPSTCWFSEQNHNWVEASKVLVRAFVEGGGQRAVVVGSCAEYDWTHPQPCSEVTTPTNSQTLYGICKNELRDWASDYAAKTGVSLAWARPFFLYGPREHPDRVVTSVIRSLREGKPVACTAGTQQRDFLYVQDVARGLLALLKSEMTGCMNLASGHAVSVREMIEHVSRICGRPELVQFGARPTPAYDPPLLVANIERQTRELGWSPTISLASGLAATLRWWDSLHAGSEIEPARPAVALTMKELSC